MKTAALTPAEVRYDQPGEIGTPYASAYGDVYHARAGALAQARQVFLAGNSLPARWCRQPRFVVLETGFGLGNNFLATWEAWRADPQRCTQLVFVSIEKHPLRREDLARAHAESPLASMAAELLAQWPPLTPDLHTLDFEQGQVRLLLALGDVRLWQSQLAAAADAIYLDGFAPSRNAEMWSESLCKSLARLAAPQATAATWSIARSLRDGLRTAGFDLRRAAGFGGKRDRLEARLPADLPAQRRRPAPPGRRPARPSRDALVIGAGLAGAAAARALARDGVPVQVLERHTAPAQATSGNLAGLFHGVLHAQDGSHAQLLRACALRAEQLLRPLVQAGALPGQVQGLLRGIDVADHGEAAAPAMAALAQGLGLPADFVQALDRDTASARAGTALAGPQWLHPGGGWINPPALVRHWLQAPGIRLQTGAAVARLNRADDGRWQALDAGNQVLAEADVLVLASAHDCARLLREWTDVDAWPLESRRGQVSVLPAALAQAGRWPRPHLPLASGGYLIGLPESLGGGLLCGATNQLDDGATVLRADDHRQNLEQVARLTGQAVRVEDRVLAEVTGRVGFRLACSDRLPLVGPVPAGPAERAGARQLEQARHVPRVPGLYVLSALGSRGITLAPLLGEVLSAWITGAPVPLAADLMDAIDPARWVARAIRHGG